MNTEKMNTDIITTAQTLVVKLNMSQVLVEQIAILEKLAKHMIESDVLLNLQSFREIIPKKMSDLLPFVPDENKTYKPLLNALLTLIQYYYLYIPPNLLRMW